MEQIRVNLNDDDRFKGTLEFIRDMTKHYSEVLGFTEEDILEKLEEKRNYWSANYYQLANFPKLDGDVVVYESLDDMKDHIDISMGFTCPFCGGVSKDPYQCDTGKIIEGTEDACNWKAYGLFGTAGKGMRFTIKEGFLENPKVDEIFMPVSVKEKESR